MNSGAEQRRAPHIGSFRGMKLRSSRREPESRSRRSAKCSRTFCRFSQRLHRVVEITSPETRKPRNPGLSACYMVRTERLELSHLAAPEPKSGVSTNFTTSAKQGLNENARQCLALSGIWGGRRGSNPRHQEPQSCALPTELRPPYFACLPPNCLMAHPAGLEPATIRLEGGCSIQLSYGRFICILFGAQT